MPDAEDAWRMRIAAALLGRGAMLHRLSLLLTAAALIMLAPLAAGTFGSNGARLVPACLVVAAAGCVEFWFAARVEFDADLFTGLAAHGDIAGFDRAMQELGLAAAPKPDRLLDDRIRGALRLLKIQAVWLAAQIAGVLLAALILFLRTPQ